MRTGFVGYVSAAHADVPVIAPAIAMQITVHGAGGGEVTGSAYLVQTALANVLVDFGLFQGAKTVQNANRLPSRDMVNRLDAVVLESLAEGLAKRRRLVR